MFGFLKKARSFPTPPALPPLTAAQLRPRIKHVDYIRTLREAGVPPDQIPDHVPLCGDLLVTCLLYTSPSPRDGLLSRMPSSA